MSYTRKRQSLESWILESLNDKENGDCSVLSLVHMVGMGEHEVYSVKIGNKAWSETELGALFKRKAESYAQDLPGVQSFCLLAFFGLSTSPGARHPFRIAGDFENSGLATEGPHPAGQVQQGMRLTEAIVQGSFRQNSTTFEVMLRYMEMQSRANVRLVDQNNSLFDMLRQNHVMLMEMQQKVLGIEERKQLFGMVPALVNAVTGENVLPTAVEEQGILGEIVNDLTPERLAHLQQALPPAVWTKIVPRLTKLIEERKAAEQSANEVGETILANGVTPEDDVIGGGISRGTNGAGSAN